MGLFGGRKNKDRLERTQRLITDKCTFGYLEAYRTLRTNLTYLLDKNGYGHVIMVTSSVPGEGKSNISINIAISLAHEKKKVLLIDFDLRTGTLGRYLNIPKRHAGVTDVLSGDEPDWHSAVIYLDKYKISAMPAGMIVENATELLGSPRMTKMISQAEKEFDYIIMDTAPVNAVADTSVIGRYADGCIMVVSHNQVNRESALAAKQQLEQTGVRILGTVLNMYDAKNAGAEGTKYYSYYNSDYGYGGYGYGYGYGERQRQEAEQERAEEPEDAAK